MNKNNTVNYTGVTNNLVRRLTEHKSHLNVNSFSATYNVTKLVHYELFHDIKDAITREKKIKNLNKINKLNLIKSHNPDFSDLSVEWDEFNNDESRHSKN